MNKNGIEWQVCSLDLSQKLNKLGVKQKSYWYWQNGNGFIDEPGWKIGIWGAFNENDCYAAFTVAELGKMLGGVNEAFVLEAYGKVFNVPDTRVITGYGLYQCLTDPNILAKMLIYLLENKLL